jgi:hypothetical protein
MVVMEVLKLLLPNRRHFLSLLFLYLYGRCLDAASAIDTFRASLRQYHLIGATCTSQILG